MQAYILEEKILKIHRKPCKLFHGRPKDADEKFRAIDITIYCLDVIIKGKRFNFYGL